MRAARAIGGALIACIVHVSEPAEACGIAAPSGAFVRLAGERAVVIWDSEHHVEHFIRKPRFEGSARTFGFFVPTPSVPRVGRVDDAILDRVASLVPAAPAVAAGGAGTGGAAAGEGVEVLQRVQIDGFELVTLKAGAADELGAWLGKNGYVDRPDTRRWTRRYLSKGWLINALKYAPGDSVGPRAVHTPTLRLSFAVDRPFYPYTEPPPDPDVERGLAEQRAMLTDLGMLGAPAPPRRTFDLWVIAAAAVDAYQAGERLGPARVASVQVSGTALARALGDTQGWDFGPGAGDWTVTQFRDDSARRTAFDDLTFASTNDASFRAAAEPPAVPRRGRWLFLLLLATLALGVAFAFADRDR